MLPRVVFLDTHPTVSFFRYTEVVEDIPTLLTRTAMVIDPRLVSLKDKLAAMRVNLMTRYSDFDYTLDRGHFQSDSFKYGSGDYHHLTDDEDLWGINSGDDMYSGSGSGTTMEVDVVTDGPGVNLIPTKSINNFDSEDSQDPSGGSSCLTISIATVLMMTLTLTLL